MFENCRNMSQKYSFKNDFTPLCKAPIFRVEVAMKTKSRLVAFAKVTLYFRLLQSVWNQLNSTFHMHTICKLFQNMPCLSISWFFWGHSFMQKRKKKLHDYSILCKYVVLEGAIKRVGCFEAIFLWTYILEMYEQIDFT